MNRAIVRTALLAAIAALLAAPAAAGTETYKIDLNHSSIAFKIRHLFSKVPGRFNDYQGTIVVDRENLENSTVEVTIQVKSIDTANERRDGHLVSPDFFDAESHPEITFKSTKIVMEDDIHAAVHGDLTIRGITKPVVLETEVLGFGPAMGGFKSGFNASTTINRKDFGIVWNRVLDSGGAVLGEDVEISLDIEANLEEPPAEPSES